MIIKSVDVGVVSGSYFSMYTAVIILFENGEDINKVSVISSW